MVSCAAAWRISVSYTHLKNIVTDFTVDEKQKQELSDRMAAQTAFSMEKERPDGTETTVFYCPVKVGGETWWSSTGLYTSDAQRAVRSTTMLLLLPVSYTHLSLQ